ncbi:MAG: pilus assembly protein [Actinobacteria bacterium]|nr:pilus assembly protein [Actinomycetota bacterium]
MNSHPRRDERGEAAIEIALLAPLLGALVLLVIFGGRVALARQTVQAAAADAARAASIARDAQDAKHSAGRLAEATLDAQGITCASSAVEVDTRGFAEPVGTPATTTVTVSCDVLTADLIGLPGVPGSVHVEHAMTSPLDRYRERR